MTALVVAVLVTAEVGLVLLCAHLAFAIWDWIGLRFR